MIGWLRGLVGARSSLENPRVPLSDVAAVEAMVGRWASGWGALSTSGQRVTAETALEAVPLWCGLDFLAGTIAALPLHVYERDGQDRQRANAGGLAALLHDAPNGELTSYEWRYQAIVAMYLSPGRAFAYIERNTAGRTVALWPLNPFQTKVERRQGRKRYIWQDEGRERVYEAAEVLDFVRFPLPDGVGHVDPVVRLRDAVGLYLDLQQYAARFFANGGMPPLALEGPVGSPAATARADQDVHAAVKQANAERRRYVPLPPGYKLVPIGTDPEKGQLVEARRFQLEEMARFLGLPPVFLADLSHGSFANTEQQDLHVTKHTITRLVRRLEQEINAKLWPGRQRFFAEFDLRGLLRGDYLTRMQGHAIAVQNALRTPDEIRRVENDPPMGGDAARLHIQGATVPLGEQTANSEGTSDDA